MALSSSQVALTAASTYSQYASLKAQGNYQSQIALSNARMAGIQADDAVQRGEKDVLKSQQETKAVGGAQRAALGAQGVAMNSGSALDVQEDTAGRGAMDALMIRNNAWRTAWGYKVQAQQDTTQAAFDKLAARNQARATLLTGGLEAARSFASGADRWTKAGDTSKRWMA